MTKADSELTKAIHRLETSSAEQAERIAKLNLRLEQALQLLRPAEPRKLAEVNQGNVKALQDGVHRLVARYEETTGLHVGKINYDRNSDLVITLDVL